MGIVADVKTAGLQAPVEPALYLPFAQTGAMGGGGIGILIRGPLPAEILAGELRTRVAELDSTAAVVDIQTMHHRLTESAARPRLAALLLGCFAVLGLVLASVGLYGVMAYLVRSRSREIGIRLAIAVSPLAHQQAGGQQAGRHRCIISSSASRTASAGTAVTTSTPVGPSSTNVRPSPSAFLSRPISPISRSRSHPPGRVVSSS